NRGSPCGSLVTMISSQCTPSGLPSALISASLAANRPARERSGLCCSLGANRRSRNRGVRSTARSKRARSTRSTPMPTITLFLSPPPGVRLLDGDGLGQVAGLVDIETLRARQFHCENLQRDDGEERLEQRPGQRDAKHHVGERQNRRVALFGDGDDLRAAGTDLLDVGDDLRVDGR